MFTIYNTTLLLILLVFISPQVSSSLQPVQLPIVYFLIQVALVEVKARLGSRPPSCHNKCNSCHPCMPTQAPTLPGRSRVDPFAGGFVRPPSSLTTVLGQYSNYKPMDWKCHCNGHFYNP
ncbi:unnamed protein product [Brassica rapa subsp. trilocularis]